MNRIPDKEPYFKGILNVAKSFIKETFERKGIKIKEVKINIEYENNNDFFNNID